MKKKDKKFIYDIQYSENEIAKKILQDVKMSYKIFYLTFLLETITYILLAINITKTIGLFFITALYFIISIDLSFSQKKYFNKVMKESINKTICPEAFLNLNLYNIKRKICGKRLYNYSINNIAYAYIQLGQLDRALDIIKYLNTIDKDLLLQSEIIKNKIDIAFWKDDLKTFNKESENLKNIIKFIPGKIKKEAKLNMNIKQAIIDKNTTEVNDWCTSLEKDKNLFNKVQSAYYKGLVQEKKNKQNYEEYYRFVAEHGNNLMIATEARKKLKINETINKYDRKLHIIYKIFRLFILAIFLSSSIFWLMYTIYIFNIK